MEFILLGLFVVAGGEYFARAIFGVGMLDLLTLVPEGDGAKADRTLYRPHPATNPGDKYYLLYHPD